MNTVARMVVVLALLVVLAAPPAGTEDPRSAASPAILPSPRDLRFDDRLITIRSALIATDETAEMKQVAAQLARELRERLPGRVTVGLPQGELDPNTTLFIIGNPQRINWLNGLDQIWNLAPQEARNHPEGYFVVAAASQELTYVICASRTGRGAFYATQSLLQVMQDAEDGVTVPRLNLADWPAFQNRGIIEGFYGRPWSWEERGAMIEFAGRNKMNWFILAPKDAPWHRSHWQEPHPPEELQALRRLNGVARENHVGFCYAISPGLSMTMSDPGDVDLLLNKIAAVQRQGIRAFALLLDDIPPYFRSAADRARFRTLGEAHAYVANAVYRSIKRRDPGCRLFFCPTLYYGNRPTEYIRTIAAQLPRDVFIFWTGPGIVSMSLTESDSAAQADVLRRAPFYWDNFPVNDYDRTRFFLGPLAQRAPRLHEHAAGLVANPMNEPEASRLPLSTVADYLWNPATYSPNRSWENAVNRLVDPELTPSLRSIARLSAPNRFWRVDGVNLEDRINRLWNAWNAGDGEESVDNLRRTLDQLRGDCEVLSGRPLPGTLTIELGRLITQTYSLCVLGNEALDLLQATRRGDPDCGERARSLRDQAEQIDGQQIREGLVSAPALDALRDFVQRCAELPQSGGSTRAQRFAAQPLTFEAAR